MMCRFEYLCVYLVEQRVSERSKDVVVADETVDRICVCYEMGCVLYFLHVFDWSRCTEGEEVKKFIEV